MGGFFLFEQCLQFIRRYFTNLFERAGVNEAEAAANSGIEKYGWYGHLLGVTSLTDLERVKKINLYEFLTYLSYKKAEFKMNNYVKKN